MLGASEKRHSGLVAKKKIQRRSDCPIVNTLEIVGDRWTLVVVRDLMFRGLREYGHFLRAGENIATNILAERLDRLVCAGLVLRSDHPNDQKKKVYLLTEKGIDLAPLMIDLALWGATHIPNTAAPRETVRQMTEKRDEFIATLKAGLLKELQAARRSRR